MEIGILLILLIGALASLYLAGKLIFKCVRFFRGGHVANALWLASALCAAIGIGILTLNEKSFLGIILLGFMYSVIRGFWVLLHWVTGTPLNDSDASPSRSDGSDDGFYPHLFKGDNDDDDLLTSPRYSTLPGNIFRVDSGLGTDHDSSSSLSSWDSWSKSFGDR